MEINIEQLPDSSFAFIVGDQRLLAHHTDAVKKSTENASVDIEMLKQSLSDLKTTNAPEDAANHLRKHARALDMSDEDIEALIGDIEVPADPMVQLDSITSIADAEAFLDAIEDNDELADMAYEKVLACASVGREALSDSYEGIVEIKDKKEDGSYAFQARVAQCDKVNKNRRLYPKDEFEKNMKRVNRLCGGGRFTGRDGHAGMSFFGGDIDRPSEICVRYDRVFLQGEDLIMEGSLIPTQAGKDIATLWDHGVQTEWSIVGYGNQEWKGEGKNEYSEITDYVLLGCDPVRMGAADTRTLVKTKNEPEDKDKDDSDQSSTVQDAVEEVVLAEESIQMADEITTEVVVDEAPKAPEIDVDAIVAQALADVTTQAASVAADAAKNAVAEAMAAARAAQSLSDAIKDAIAKLSEGDPLVAQAVSAHFTRCATAEEVATVVEQIAPMAEGLRKPKAFEGVGNVHIGDEREKYMLIDQNTIVDRPETIEGVKAMLVDGLPEKRWYESTQAGQHPRNLKWVMESIIANYEKTRDMKKYLYACTKRGYQETATGTSALGTTLPQVLPMIRQILPSLIPYEIGAVVPIDRPDARIHFFDPHYEAGTNGATADGSNLDDSSVFDTGWADHTEADTKSQISFGISYTDVEVEEKSIYWDLTSAVIQDLQAIHGLDAEAEMMSAASGQIAREINYKFIELLCAGAGISAGTYGTAKPTSVDSLEKWLDWGLTQWVNSASKDISKKMDRPADWIVTGPTQAALFTASAKFEPEPVGPQNQFGLGLRKLGNWSSLYNVYVADWAEKLTSLKNKMLFGYYAPEWMYTAAVFCPYIPIYVSPVDATASTNTIARSVSSRNAMKVIQANGLALLTVSDATGTVPDYTD